MSLQLTFGSLHYDTRQHLWALELGMALGYWVSGYSWQIRGMRDVPDEEDRTRHWAPQIQFGLRNRNVHYSLPLYSDRHNPNYGGPVGRASTVQYEVLDALATQLATQLSAQQVTQSLAFFIIGSAAVMFHQLTSTPEAKVQLTQLARNALGNIDTFCPSLFRRTISTETIIDHLRSRRGLRRNIENMFEQAHQRMVVLLVQADPVPYRDYYINEEGKVITPPRPLLLQEHQRIHDVLGIDQRLYQLQVLPNAQPENLQSTIMAMKPTIIHFAGHGDLDGIRISGADLHEVPVRTSALRDILDDAEKDGLQCVIMNNCYTAEAYQSGFAGQKAILMPGAINSREALAFSGYFYGYLGRGENVDAAFRRARNDIALDTRTSLAPVLIQPRSNGRP